MAPRVCVITDKDTVQIAKEGYLLNGNPLASLSGCQFKGEVRIVAQVEEVAPAPAAVAPPASPSAIETSQPPKPASPTFTGELAEINDWVIVGQQLLNLPPWLAVLIAAAIIFQKIQKNRTATCMACAPLNAKVQQLEAAVQAYEARINRLEAQDMTLQGALKLISAQDPPPPTETQEWSKK